MPLFNFTTCFNIIVYFCTCFCINCHQALDQFFSETANFIQSYFWISFFFSFSKAISSLSASMDGTMLLSGSADCMVKLWHVDSRQCLRTFSFKGEYYWLEQKIDDEDARAVFFRSSLVILDVFFALTLSCLVLTKDHTYLPKPAAFRG